MTFNWEHFRKKYSIYDMCSDIMLLNYYSISQGLISLLSTLYFLSRCVTGNLAEFVLRPVFAQRGTVFGCHIAPKKNYKIYDISYSVTKDGKPINSDRNTELKAVKMFDGNHPDKATERYGFFLILLKWY